MNAAQVIDMKKMLDILSMNRKEENANQKNFVFKMKCEKLSTTDSKPHTVFVMSQSNKKSDTNEAENWLTAVEFMRTKFAFE